MAGKENDDFELNLKDADGGVGSIDALLAADGNDAPAAGGNGNADDDDDFIDFNDFSIDDLDTALSKYEASRGGGKSKPAQTSAAEPAIPAKEVAVDDAGIEPEMPRFDAAEETLSDFDALTAAMPQSGIAEAEPEIPEFAEKPRFDASAANRAAAFGSLSERGTAPAATVAELMAAVGGEKPESPAAGGSLPAEELVTENPATEENLSAEKPVTEVPGTENAAVSAEENKPEEACFLSEEDRRALGCLRWYDGTLGEKVYEVSLNNMPEFLDYDKSIKTIHVNIDSPYGWNVFFENGVFMNLMDLKEYQERNGSLPGTNGKIIYGSRMSSFEKIERIVVYEKPRYFSYGLKK